MRKYSQSPLPFQGQKRNFVKEFKQAVSSYPDDAIYVDLFGGSGLLSHIVKTEKPKVKVVYNDYDNFKERLSNVHITNKILQNIRKITSSYKKGIKLNKKDKSKIIELIKYYEKKYFIDYITLSSNLLFSMNYVTSIQDLEKQTFYAKARKNDYEVDGYLNGVDFIRADYRELINKYGNNPNVVFLVDPPYLSTDCSTYNSKYWKLKDYLEVLTILHKKNYFYFTSNKSSIIELCDWIASNTNFINPFANAKIVYRYNSTSHNTGYTDIMMHKYITSTTLDNF